MRVVGVVLAAGESRRMGRLKALLPFGAHTVIEHVLQPLLQADLAAVVVVLGHRAADIAAVLEQLPVHLLHNPQYQHGMTTSVQVALRDITPVPDAYLLAWWISRTCTWHSFRSCWGFCAYAQGAGDPRTGKRGHPILLSATYRQEVLALGPAPGLEHGDTRASGRYAGGTGAE